MVGAMRLSWRQLCSTCPRCSPGRPSAFPLIDQTAGWRAVANDAYVPPSTDVIFIRTVERAKVEVIYRSGKLKIKR
jgi:hypothetical protein